MSLGKDMTTAYAASSFGEGQTVSDMLPAICRQVWISPAVSFLFSLWTVCCLLVILAVTPRHAMCIAVPAVNKHLHHEETTEAGLLLADCFIRREWLCC